MPEIVSLSEDRHKVPTIVGKWIKWQSWVWKWDCCVSSRGFEFWFIPVAEPHMLLKFFQNSPNLHWSCQNCLEIHLKFIWSSFETACSSFEVDLWFSHTWSLVCLNFKWSSFKHWAKFCYILVSKWKDFYHPYHTSVILVLCFYRHDCDILSAYIMYVYY